MPVLTIGAVCVDRTVAACSYQVDVSSCLVSLCTVEASADPIPSSRLQLAGWLWIFSTFMTCRHESSSSFLVFPAGNRGQRKSEKKAVGFCRHPPSFTAFRVMCLYPPPPSSSRAPLFSTRPVDWRRPACWRDRTLASDPGTPQPCAGSAQGQWLHGARCAAIMAQSTQQSGNQSAIPPNPTSHCPSLSATLRLLHPHLPPPAQPPCH